MKPQKWFVLLLLFGFSILVGCNSSNQQEDQGPVGKLWGHVTFKGKKVLLGKVMVVSDNGRGAFGHINSDGTYLIEKAPAGKARLFLELPELPPELNPKGPGGPPSPPMPPDAPKAVDPAKDLEVSLKEGFKSIANIPRSYTLPDLSGFQTEVKENQENEYNLKMVDRSK